MTDYVSILTCFSETAAPTNEDEDLNTEEKKEVEETVEDLLSMKNQEMLKKNLVNIVTENLRNKKKVKILESDLADRKENISFLIDCDGQDGQEEDSHQSHQSQQRVYSDFTVLGETSEPESPAASKGGSCFNCDGSHIVSDCTQPRDEDKIARRRSEMKGSKGPTSARYHLEGGQKFDHLQPGLPSDKLREALGLRSDELPRYIYDMRELGYPPGWLVAARVTNSGLALYHTGDTKMDTGEEGEVESGPRSTTLTSWSHGRALTPNCRESSETIPPGTTSDLCPLNRTFLTLPRNSKQRNRPDTSRETCRTCPRRTSTMSTWPCLVRRGTIMRIQRRSK